jgi:hypothetical protein
MLINKTKKSYYTTRLQAGLGLIEETKALLSIYEPYMDVQELHAKSLESGLFPMMSARRLRNVIAECFAPRYMKTDSAQYLKPLSLSLSTSELKQLLLIFTVNANLILYDFIVEVYWKRYSSGRDKLSTDDAKDFVENAVSEGKTQKAWAESTIKRVASYLVGCCADYDLLSSKSSSIRELKTVRINKNTVLFLSYWLHLKGVGDNSIISHKIWKIFGLEPSDVREEFNRLSGYGSLIVQTAGDVSRISWKQESMEDVVDVITQS